MYFPWGVQVSLSVPAFTEVSCRWRPNRSQHTIWLYSLYSRCDLWLASPASSGLHPFHINFAMKWETDMTSLAMVGMEGNKADAVLFFIWDWFIKHLVSFETLPSLHEFLFIYLGDITRFSQPRKYCKASNHYIFTNTSTISTKYILNIWFLLQLVCYMMRGYT